MSAGSVVAAEFSETEGSASASFQEPQKVTGVSIVGEISLTGGRIPRVVWEAEV